MSKVVSKLKRVIQEAKLKFSLTEGGKDGKSKLIESNKFEESRIFGLCEDEGIGVADNVATWELMSENKHRSWEKRDTKRRCVRRFGVVKKTKDFINAYTRTGANKVL